MAVNSSKNSRKQATDPRIDGSISHGWCGGWDSNPRRPSPQGPKPETGVERRLLPIRPGSGTPANPQFSRSRPEKGWRRIKTIHRRPVRLASPQNRVYKPSSLRSIGLSQSKESRRLDVTVKSFGISPDQRSGRGVPRSWLRTFEGPPHGNYRKQPISPFRVNNRQSRPETFQMARGPVLGFRNKKIPATQECSYPVSAPFSSAYPALSATLDQLIPRPES